MNQLPRCKYYDAKDQEESENCSNCHGWLNIRCADHLELLKEYETRRKVEEYEREMRGNQGMQFK